MAAPTPTEREQICKDYLANLPIIEICNKYNVSRKTVYRVLEAGSVQRKTKGYNASILDISRKFHTKHVSPPKRIAIATRFMNGENKTQIARKENVAISTVAKILNSEEMKAMFEEGRSRVAQMIPKAADVADFHLDQQDKDVAMQILKGTGALGGDDKNHPSNGGVTLNFALFDPQRADELIKRLSSSEVKKEDGG